MMADDKRPSETEIQIESVTVDMINGGQPQQPQEMPDDHNGKHPQQQERELEQEQELSSCDRQCASVFAILCEVILYVIGGCIGVAVGLAFLPIFFSCLMIVLIMATSLLMALFVVVRLLQFVHHKDNDYYRAIHFTSLIRFLLYVNVIFLLIVMGIFSLVAIKVPRIKHVTLAGLPITQWITITSILCGFYLLSCCVFVGAQALPLPPLWQYKSLIKLVQALSETMDFVIILLAESQVMKRLPNGFKQHRILGLHTRKWIEVPIFVLIGINAISICCHSIAYLLHIGYKKLDPAVEVKSMRYLIVEKVLRRKWTVYWANGLRSSIIFIFSSMLLLLTWVLYFRSHLNATPEAKRVLALGTWFCTSLLILAFLWLIKSCILLMWDANQVYTRLNSRILDTRKKLYFLGILGRRKYDIFYLRGYSPFGEPLPRKPSAVPRIDGENQEINNPGKESHQSVGTFGFFLDVTSVMLDIFIADFYNDDDDDDDDDQVAEAGRRVEKPKQFRIMQKFVNNHVFLYKYGFSYSYMRNRVKDDFLMHNDSDDSTPTLHDIQQTAQYFLAAQPALSNNKYASDILNYLKDSAHKRNETLEENLKRLLKGKSEPIDGAQNTTLEKILQKISKRLFKVNGAQNMTLEEIWKENLKRLFKGKSEPIDGAQIPCESPGEDDWNNFKSLLNSESGNDSSDDEISETKLRIWLERAHSTCLALANTLISAKEVVDCLNSIISGLLIGAIFIMWLLLTGLATTKILVIIASPLLAATFIFGDTCKSLFQGIIFVYVLHPFNVGDLCIIDDKMMEVKIIGVWKTIFAMIGTCEEVTYPNSELANKKVINHKSEFDWNDRLEFILRSCRSKRIKALKTKINDHLNKDERCAPNSHSIEVLTVEDDVKMVVHLKYKYGQQGMTFFECLQIKHELRSEFAIDIQKLLK